MNSAERVSVSIFPNPTESGVSIKVIGEENRAWRYEMIDAMGRIVLDENNILETNKSFLLPRLIQSGVYFLKIYLHETTIERRIVVIK